MNSEMRTNEQRSLFSRHHTAWTMVVLFFALVFGFAAPTLAASGKIVGQVVSAETGDPVLGASVYITNTTMGAATDLDGKYSINSVPEGTYTLMISSVGFTKLEITEVTVSADETVKLDVALETKMLEGKTIKVTAQRVQNTEAALLVKRQKSVTISDAISSEAISRSGSGDAAEAMSRVTGASVVDGKNVFVRGLGGRYSNTRINGSLFSTPDPEQRSVPMDLFPTNLLDNVTVEKSYTPDKPGNFSGGSVDLQTKDIPEDMTLSFSTSVKYNSNVTGKDFITSPRGDMEWFAFDNGYRDLPVVLEESGTATTPSRPQDLSMEELEAREEIYDAFASTFSPTFREAPLGESHSVSFGNKYNLAGKPLGILASLTYSRDYSYYDDGVLAKYNNADQDITRDLQTEYKLPELRGKEEVSWGGLVNASYKFHSNHKVGMQYMYNRQGKNEAAFIQGQMQASTGGNYQGRIIKYTEQGMGNFQLNGEHYLKPFKINWKTAFSNSERGEPDNRLFENDYYAQAVIDEETGDTVGYDTVSYDLKAPGTFYRPYHFFRNVDENTDEYKLDLEVPLLKRMGKDLKVSSGLAFFKQERQYRERIFRLGYSPSDSKFDGNPDEAVSPDNVGIDWSELPDSPTSYRYDTTFNDEGEVIGIDTVGMYRVYSRYYDRWIYEDAATAAKNSYDGEMEVFATYIMFNVPISGRINMITGLRYEKTDMNIFAYPNGESYGTIDVGDVLPSLSFTYSLNDAMNLRLAYGRTLARPTMREKSEANTFEWSNGLIFLGNPDLDRTLIDNFDIRWEWFTGPGEILAVSAYYKDFKNPIERVLFGPNNNVKYENVDKAEVYGAEFEFRQGLDIISSSLRNFHFESNLSLTHSEISIGEDLYETKLYYDSSASNTRQLQGQSPFLLNAGLTYDNYTSGTVISLLYNVFGNRLSYVMKAGLPDVYEESRSMLDLTFSQRIMPGLKFKLTAKNLLDAEERHIMEREGKDYLFRGHGLGRSISLGVSYKL